MFRAAETPPTYRSKLNIHTETESEDEASTEAELPNMTFFFPIGFIVHSKGWTVLIHTS